MSVAVGAVVAPAQRALGQTSQAAADVHCAEDSTWLVRRGRMPVYNNVVFTKGFTYTMEWAGDSASLAPQEARFDTLGENVRQAIESALTYWAVSLLLVRRNLDSALARYVEDSLACDGANCVYNAPPADRVRCRRNASLAIVAYGPGGPRFPAREPFVVAQSAKPGRTVLLNFQDYAFAYDQRLFTIWGPRERLNLTAVLAHELGHSFGLPDLPVDAAAIMAGDMSDARRQRIPSAQDGRAFATILALRMNATAVGEFEPLSCRGLRVRPPQPDARPFDGVSLLSRIPK